MSEPRKTPGPFAVLAVVLLVVPLGIAGWYFYGRSGEDPKPKTISDLDVVCTGRVDAPSMVIALEPSSAGRVVKIFAAEGATLEDQQPILFLDDSLAQHRLKQAKAAVKVATIDRDRSRLDAARYPNQIEAKKALGKSVEAQVKAAEKNLENRKALAGVQKPGDAELLALESSVEQLRQLKKAEDLQIADYEKMLADKQPDLIVDAAESRLSAARADEELAQKGVDECTLRAPCPGRLLRMQASVGGFLLPGGFVPAIVFAPAGKLVVRAEVDQEYLGRVKVGQGATLKDDSRVDSQQWTGKVKSLAGWIAQRRTIILDPGEINDVRTAECLIELDSDDDLFIGQRMRVRISTK